MEGVDLSDGAAWTDNRTRASRAGRRAALGVPLPDRRPQLEACAAGWVRLRAGRTRGARARAGAASTGAADRAEAHARRARRDVLGSTRCAAGDDREAPLPAQQGDGGVRRSKGRRVEVAGDRRVADAVVARLPLRGNPGASPSSAAGGGVGDDRPSTRPRSASTTRSGGARSSIRSSHGRSWRRSPRRSGLGTGR
jgi:hypothetical protein